MTTKIFSQKLDGLIDTIEQMVSWDVSELASALLGSRGHHVLAIGSGGSAVSAEYLSRCRDTLSLGPTTVQTPMSAVVGTHDLANSEVWIFSAGSANADVIAAVRAAKDRRCRALRLITRSPTGEAAELVERRGGSVYAVPVSDDKDGYLATHSLIATVVALLVASDAASGNGSGQQALIEKYRAHVEEGRKPEARAMLIERFSTLRTHDTIVLLADPQLSPIATLLDTSLWEASLCTVQTTDLRNFAHGRHSWLHHRGDETCVLALVGQQSREIYNALATNLSPELRCWPLDHGDCGRYANAAGIFDGLLFVEAFGSVLGIDPGKPGIADFGREMYEARGLEDLAVSLSPVVRHKRRAQSRFDDVEPLADPLIAVERARLRRLAEAEIGGVVLDYDGTIISTDDRKGSPRSDIVEEISRLASDGLVIGIATGRGGSIGCALRTALPRPLHAGITVGYYNGGLLRKLDLNIEDEPDPYDAAVAETAEWFRENSALFSNFKMREKGLQLTVEADDLLRPYQFSLDIAVCPPIREGRVKVVRSGHSFDFIPSSSTKLNVVEVVRASTMRSSEVLCFGDSGGRSGNDYALLAHPFGISVGEVCGAADGCWSLFGDYPTGPDALLKVLRALRPDEGRRIRLDVQSLSIDSP